MISILYPISRVRRQDRYPISTYIFTTAESDAKMTSKAPHTRQLAYDVQIEVDLTCSDLTLI